MFLYEVPENAVSSPLGPGAIVAWVVCAARKRYSIGGWLLFYYWQIFAGAALAAFMICTAGYRSYMPEIHGTPMHFWLFFISAAPYLVLLFLQAAVGLMLLCVRTWDVLELLRYVVLASAAFAWIGVTIDLYKFEANVPLSVTAAIQMTVWTIYFFVSKRVESVFKHDNWEQPLGQGSLRLT